MSDKYYRDTWLAPQSHGQLFWQKTNFDLPKYRFQENVFRKYLRDNFKGKGQNTSMNILELGVGRGRMTKIMFQELGPFNWYVGVDIDKDGFKSIGNEWGVPACLSITPITGDLVEIMNKPLPHKVSKYDLVLASETLMHIKPDDIDFVIERIGELGKEVINIDWYPETPKPSEWCFAHDYRRLYSFHNAEFVNMFNLGFIEQALFHYRFS